MRQTFNKRDSPNRLPKQITTSSLCQGRPYTPTRPLRSSACSSPFHLLKLKKKKRKGDNNTPRHPTRKPSYILSPSPPPRQVQAAPSPDPGKGLTRGPRAFAHIYGRSWYVLLLYAVPPRPTFFSKDAKLRRPSGSQSHHLLTTSPSVG